MSWLRERTIVTEKELNLSWSGRKDNFRCGLCGDKFKVGEGFRMVFTNNLAGYGGNPLVCDKCDGADVIERWKKLWDEFNTIIKNKKYWRMVRNFENQIRD